MPNGEGRHPADSRDLPATGNAPTAAPVVSVRDIAVIPIIHGEGTDEDYEAHPPADGVDLGHGVSIEVLPHHLAELVMDASSARGHFFIATRQFGQCYSFVSNVSLDTYSDHPYGYDEDGRLATAIALSRFVRDNSHAAEFAGRVVEHADGELQVVPLTGFEFRLAYRLKNDRGWLDAPEAQELAALFGAFLPNDANFPPRVRRAIKSCDRSSQLPFLSEAQPRLVTGLEALLSTSKRQVTRQFRERLAALGDEVGVAGVSRKFADRMYDARSQAYHGSEIRLVSGDPDAPQPVRDAEQRKAIEETARLQDVLRRTLRRAIEDAAFRGVFVEEARIRARWPVRARVGNWWDRRRSEI